MKSISAENLPLDKVMTKDFEFEIPRYQRPYSWETDHAVQLLDDLDQALTENASEPYFLGSIVLVKEDGNPHAEVIDGQQRLTTLTILLGVLRDLSTTDAVREGIQECIADKGKAWKVGVKPKQRLTLRPQDREFFRAYVQTEGATSELLQLTDNAADSDSRRAIRDNAAALHGILVDWSEDRRIGLFDFLLEETQLVVVSTPDETSAHRIFGVMNARGLELSPTDIFKSKVIGDLGALEDEYATKWDHAEDSIGRENFVDLFRDVRTVMTKRPAKFELLREFEDQVLGAYLTSGQQAAFVDELLVPYANAFEMTVDPSMGPGADWHKVNEWLKRLALFDNVDWRPVVLWALKHHHDDPVMLDVFLRKVERLAAGMLLLGMYSTPRIARYLDVLSELSAHGAASPSLDLTTSERADAWTALNGEIYRLQSRRRRLILLRLDGLLAVASGATYDHKIITVEHVLPQKPPVDSQWLRDFDADDRAHWTHRLGNLVLLNTRANSSARNYEFDKKKQKYFKSKTGSTNFAITTQVIDEPVWTPAVVASRQSALVQLLTNEWGLS